MADIYLAGLYDQKKRQYGSLGNNGVARFDLDFIDAVNRAIKRINVDANLSTAISTVDSVEDTVELDDKYEGVVSDGIDLYLQQMGRRPPKGQAPFAYDIAERFADGISHIQYDIINDASIADTDDNTTSIVGLGILG